MKKIDNWGSLTVLAETPSSIPCLASLTSLRQGKPGLHCSPGPLEGPLLVQAGCGGGDSVQKKSRLHRCFQVGLGISSLRQTEQPGTPGLNWVLHLWPLNGSLVDLPENVQNTISQARAPSTRCLYALKWSVFSAWCTARGEDPSTCDISLILSFLQELLDKGHTPSTLKVYVAAIAASHDPIAGQSVGKNNLVVYFLKGSRRLNPPLPFTVPTWDLSTVLRGLKGPPFEPLQSTDIHPLSLKTALLLALASVKRVGDLQALSVSPSCLEFGPNDSKVILKPRHGYVPKVLSTPIRAQVVTLSALPPSQDDQELSET
ncbi:uncharacterized protein LOC125250684 [Megalobrama amblycephala]|uniref:uncharacterized protein LOC125250684 n=1 Tax=Megalobrama amblycephala TaxID=75352 RepID=UPI00201449DE|nr:uncharacterized protein LOC125250684 [Megalobrama amblycephala]